MKAVPRKLKITAVSIVAVLCFVVLGAFFLVPKSAFHRGSYTLEDLAEVTATTGEMTKQEALRCNSLELYTQKTGQISDRDLDWVIHMAQTPGTGNATYTHTRHLNAMLVLKHLRIFAPGQKEKIYAATAPYLASRNMQEKIGAMAAMRATKDKRAAPAVAELLKDQDSFVREMAQKTLTILNS